MSTEPAGTNGHFKHLRRTNLNLSKKDWCGYTGKCHVELDSSSNLCVYCKYRKTFDIPKMLSGVKNER